MTARPASGLSRLSSGPGAKAIVRSTADLAHALGLLGAELTPWLRQRLGVSAPAAALVPSAPSPAHAG